LASEPWAAAAGDGRRECTNVYSVGCNTYDAACILCMHICLRLSQSPDWVWVDVGDYTGRQRWGEVEGHKDAGRFCLNILFVAHLFSQHCKYIAYCTLVLAALQMYCLLRICSRSTADILLIAHFFLQHCKYIAYCALVLAALQIYCLLRTCSCSTAHILHVAHLFLQHCKELQVCWSKSTHGSQDTSQVTFMPYVLVPKCYY